MHAMTATVEPNLLQPATTWDIFCRVIDNYGDNTIRYVLRVWTKTADYWDVRNAVMLNVKSIFDAQGIAMTYPHLNVHLQSN